MGAKKLKAIAVFGDGEVPVADREKMGQLSKEWLEKMRLPDQVMSRLRGHVSKRGDYRRALSRMGFCGKNMQVNQFTEFGLGFHEQKFTSRPCPGCPIACPYDLEVMTGPHKGYVATLCSGGEALEGAGSMLGITEAGTIFRLTDLYDRLGVEGATFGSTLAMAFEAYEKKLITSSDTDGIELKWGSGEAAEKMLRKYVYREGFGDILALGPKKAAERIGGDAPDFCVHIKGSGINLHDWRASWGLLLGQIVSSAAGWPAPAADCWGAEPDAGYPELTKGMTPKGKPMEVRKTGILKTVEDCIGLCWFITWRIPGVLNLMAESISAATGWDYSVEDVLATGERTMQLERAFNIRQGLTPEDDYNVPARLIEAPADGKAAGVSMKPYLRGMINEYYRLMGWEERTGKPYKATLEKFGLKDVVKELWK